MSFEIEDEEFIEPFKMLTTTCPSCRHEFLANEGCCTDSVVPSNLDSDSISNFFFASSGYTAADYSFNASSESNARQDIWKPLENDPQEHHIVTNRNLSSGSVMIQATPALDVNDYIDCINSRELRFIQHPPPTQVMPRFYWNEPVDCEKSEDKESLLDEYFDSSLSDCQSEHESRGAEISHYCQSNMPQEIKFNSTVPLPSTTNQYYDNITTSASSYKPLEFMSSGRCQKSPTYSTASTEVIGRPRQINWNYFNGGGLVDPETSQDSPSFDDLEDVLEYDLEDDEEDDQASLPRITTLPFNVGAFILKHDFERMERTRKFLITSGWYHENTTQQQSQAILKNTSVGRWLLRDSSDYRCFFTLSLQTSRGPTSIRIVNAHCGRYQLEADANASLGVPSFECPIKLLLHYIKKSSNSESDEDEVEVFLDHTRQVFTRIRLSEPLLREPRSLLHQARLVVNRNNMDSSRLPVPLNKYLKEYPFVI